MLTDADSRLRPSYHTSLVEMIYYSFFKVFPLEHINLYHSNAGQKGLTFLSIADVTALALSMDFNYLHFELASKVKANGFGPPEQSLLLTLYVSFLPPTGLFPFGWKANSHIQWIASVIRIGIYASGVSIVLYVLLTYLQYVPGLLASNDFARSAVTAGAILFARPL